MPDVLHNLIVRGKQKPKGLRDVQVFKGNPRRHVLKAVKQDGVSVCKTCNGFGGWFASRDGGKSNVWHPCSNCDEHGYTGESSC